MTVDSRIKDPNLLLLPGKLMKWSRGHDLQALAQSYIENRNYFMGESTALAEEDFSKPFSEHILLMHSQVRTLLKKRQKQRWRWTEAKRENCAFGHIDHNLNLFLKVVDYYNITALKVVQALPSSWEADRVECCFWHRTQSGKLFFIKYKKCYDFTLHPKVLMTRLISPYY